MKLLKLLIFFIAIFNGITYAGVLSSHSKYYLQYNVLVNISSKFVDDRIGIDQDGIEVFYKDKFSVTDNVIIVNGNIVLGMVINNFVHTELDIASYSINYIIDDTTGELIKNAQSDRAYVNIDYMINTWRLNILSYKNLTTFVKAGAGVALINQPQINFDGGRSFSFAYLLASGISYNFNNYIVPEVGVKYFRNFSKRLENASSGGAFVKANVQHLTAYAGIRIMF